jgi:hypothetical protein
MTCAIGFREGMSAKPSGDGSLTGLRLPTVNSTLISSLKPVALALNKMLERGLKSPVRGVGQSPTVLMLFLL